MAGSSSSSGHSESQGQGTSQSQTYIPDYAESPILRAIAQYAFDRAPEVYEWGMTQYNKNQGNIDALMRDALSYASPQRIAVDMGMAEAGVQQAAEKGRLSAIRDLEAFGIDPSSGRYAALDSANRVMASASAAGAGNQQRMADEAAGNAMRNQSISASLQNTQLGYEAAKAMNALLGTGMQLKYPPLGQTSYSQHTQTSVSDQSSQSQQTDPAGGGGGGGGGPKGGGDKGGGGGDQPKQQGGGGGQPRQPSGGGGGQPGGGGSGGAKPGKTSKPGPTRAPPPVPPPPPPPPPDFDPNDPTTWDWTKYPDQGGTPRDTPEGGWGPIPDPEKKEGFDPNDPTTWDWSQYGDKEKGTDAEMPPDYEGAPYTYTTPETDPNQYEGAPYQSDFDQTATPWAQNEPDPNQYEGPTDYAGQYDPNQYDTATADQGYEGAPYGSDYDQTAGEGVMAGDPENAAPWQVAGGDDWQVPTDPSWDDTGWWDQQGEDVSGTGETQGGWDFSEQDFTQGLGNDQLGDQGFWDPNQYDESWDDNLDSMWGNGEWEGFDTADASWDDSGWWDDQSGGDTSWDDTGWWDDQSGGDASWDDTGWWDDQSGFDDSSFDDSGWWDDYSGDDASFDDSGWWDDYSDDSSWDDSGWWDDYSGDDASFDDSGWWDDTSGYDDSGSDASFDDSGWWDSGDSGDSGGGDYDWAKGGPVTTRGRPEMPRMARGGPMRTGYGQRRPPPGGPPQGGGMPPPRRPQPAPNMVQMAAGAPQRMPRGGFMQPSGMPQSQSGAMQAPMQPPPQRMARGGQAGGRRAEPTQGGFVSRELSPSRGSAVDDVNAKLNAGEFVIPKDVAHWKGKEFFYKLIAQARKNRAPGGGQQQQQPSQRQPTGYGGSQR